MHFYRKRPKALELGGSRVTSLNGCCPMGSCILCKMLGQSFRTNRCHTSRPHLNRLMACRYWGSNSSSHNIPQFPHIMHLPRRFALCCLFSFGALGLVRATPPDFGPNVMIFDPSKIGRAHV